MMFYTLKCVLGATISIFLANLLELNYFMTAGVILILSIQNTKRQSLTIALKRVLDFILAFTIAPIISILLEFNIYAFSLFLTIFIPISLYLKLQDGIVVNSVLVTHLLIERTITLSFIINETLILGIGVGVALIVNMYMPSIEGEIRKNEKEIETLISDILSSLSFALRKQVVFIKEDNYYKKLYSLLISTKEMSYNYGNNIIFNKRNYHLEYINMRLHQYKILEQMREHFKRLSISYKSTEYVADFTERVAAAIGEINMASPLLNELLNLRETFRNLSLPKTREEFENRALLFQFVNEIEQFLIVKIEFHSRINYNLNNRNL